MIAASLTPRVLSKTSQDCKPMLQKKDMGWQSTSNNQCKRKRMIYIIKKLVEVKGGPITESKLLLVKKLELKLYANASSFEEYSDISTLKERIMEIGQKRLAGARRNQSTSLQFSACTK